MTGSASLLARGGKALGALAAACALALSLAVAAVAPPPAAAQAPAGSLTDQLLALTGSEAFRITGLVTITARLSDDENAAGVRQFVVDNARLGVGGELDEGFHYRFQMEFAREPNLLDAFLGYRFSDALTLRAGAQKPLLSAELLPTPAGTDFLDRARLVGAQLRTRELGVSAHGTRGSFRYDVGMWNGGGLAATNVDNRFLATGRLANDFGAGGGPPVTAGVNVAWGHCRAAQCGLSGFAGDGSRRTVGADVRYESDRWIWAGEVLTTTFEVAGPGIDEERILGWHLTGGYKLSPETRLVARWDRLELREADFENSVILLGLSHQVHRLMSLQANLASVQNPDAENELRLIGGWQFAF